jgi:hypothetical protein
MQPLFEVGMYHTCQVGLETLRTQPATVLRTRKTEKHCDL